MDSGPMQLAMIISAITFTQTSILNYTYFLNNVIRCRTSTATYHPQLYFAGYLGCSEQSSKRSPFQQQLPSRVNFTTLDMDSGNLSGLLSKFDKEQTFLVLIDKCKNDHVRTRWVLPPCPSPPSPPPPPSSFDRADLSVTVLHLAPPSDLKDDCYLTHCMQKGCISVSWWTILVWRVTLSCKISTKRYKMYFSV